MSILNTLYSGQGVSSSGGTITGDLHIDGNVTIDGTTTLNLDANATGDVKFYDSRGAVTFWLPTTGQASLGGKSPAGESNFSQISSGAISGPAVTVTNDGSCDLNIGGCTDPLALNYNTLATINETSATDSSNP